MITGWEQQGGDGSEAVTGLLAFTAAVGGSRVTVGSEGGGDSRDGL